MSERGLGTAGDFPGHMTDVPHALVSVTGCGRPLLVTTLSSGAALARGVGMAMTPVSTPCRPRALAGPHTTRQAAILQPPGLQAPGSGSCFQDKQAAVPLARCPEGP